MQPLERSDSRLFFRTPLPIRVVNINDAQALEAQLVENLIRADVHPMEETQGFKALLDLEDPIYSIEQIAARPENNPHSLPLGSN
jgi:ParB family transcriptional regulator, chromosome partitioning protein